MYVCMSVGMYVRTYVYVYMCVMYVCTCVCVYMSVCHSPIYSFNKGINYEGVFSENFDTQKGLQTAHSCAEYALLQMC